MSTNTANYNLVKPATTDFYDISIENANMDKIDTALKQIDDKTLNAIQKSLVTAANDFIVGTGNGTVAKKTLAETKSILGIIDEIVGLGTLALTPTTSNQSPTDSYSGVIDVEIGGATAYATGGTTGNCEVIADFDAQVATIALDSTVKVVGSNSIKATATGVGGFGFNAKTGEFPVNPSSYYLVSAYGQKNTASTWDMVVFKGSTFSIIGGAATGLTNTVMSRVGRLLQPADLVGETSVRPYITGVSSAVGQTINGDAIQVIEISASDYAAGLSYAMAKYPTYFENLASTTEVEINTSSVNLFDINSIPKDGTYVDVVDIGVDYVQLKGTYFAQIPIALKKNQTINMNWVTTIISGTPSASYLLEYEDGSLSVQTTVGQPLTTSSTLKVKSLLLYIAGSSAVEVKYSNIILSEGPAIQPYQPHKPSQLSIKCTNPAKFELSKLPNGVQNEINEVKGYVSAVKRVKSLTLSSADLANAYGTFGSNVIYQTYDIREKNSLSDPDLSIFLSGWEHIPFSNNSNVADQYKYMTANTTKRLYFIFPSSTTLAQAQALINGIKAIDAMVTPSFIPFEDFGDNGIEVEGMLVCNDDYTNVINTANLVPNVNLEYPRNLSASADGLTHAVANAFEILTDHEGRLDILEQEDLGKLSTYRASKDSFGVWTDIQYKRKDGTLYKKSILSGGTAPNYTTRTETYYLADGVTVAYTNVYTLTFSSGELTSEVLN